MDVAALVVSVVSVLFAGGSLWYARGQKRAAAWSAESAARSATASESSAAAAEESLGITRERRAEELAEAERNRVDFRLEPQSGDRYLLQNRGTDTAYGVEVDARDTLVRGDGDLGDVRSGEGENLIIAQTVGSNTDQIVVTWHLRPDRSDDRQTKRLPL